MKFQKTKNYLQIFYLLDRRINEITKVKLEDFSMKRSGLVERLVSC